MMPDESEATESNVNSPTKLNTRDSEVEDSEDITRADDKLEVEDFDELYPPNLLTNKTFADYQSGDEIAAAAAAVAARHYLNEESDTDSSSFESDGDAADSKGLSDGEPEPAPIQIKVRLHKPILNVMFTHRNNSKKRGHLDAKLRY